MSNLNRYEPGVSRKEFCQSILWALVGVLAGALCAPSITDFFYHFAPWVGPSILIAIAGAGVLAMLLLPIILRIRARSKVVSDQ